MPSKRCLPHMILHHEILCLGSFNDCIILPSPLPPFLKQKYKQEGEKDDKKHPPCSSATETGLQGAVSSKEKYGM